jgi:hypothetical protein
MKLKRFESHIVLELSNLFSVAVPSRGASLLLCTTAVTLVTYRPILLQYVSDNASYKAGSFHLDPFWHILLSCYNHAVLREIRIVFIS